MGTFLCGTATGCIAGSATSIALEELPAIGFVLGGATGFTVGFAAETILQLKEDLHREDLEIHHAHT